MQVNVKLLTFHHQGVLTVEKNFILNQCLNHQYTTITLFTPPDFYAYKIITPLKNVKVILKNEHHMIKMKLMHQYKKKKMRETNMNISLEVLTLHTVSSGKSSLLQTL